VVNTKKLSIMIPHFFQRIECDSVSLFRDTIYLFVLTLRINYIDLQRDIFMSRSCNQVVANRSPLVFFFPFANFLLFILFGVNAILLRVCRGMQHCNNLVVYDSGGDYHVSKLS
jgi:hypothetical protein